MKKIYLKTLKQEEVIKRLKDGEVIHIEERKDTIKMIDGVIVKNYESSTTFNCHIVVDNTDDFYFEDDDEEKFEITETGLYKTRDGRKAYVSNISPDDNCVFIIEGESRTHIVTKQGRYSKIKEYYNDIVSKWED